MAERRMFSKTIMGSDTFTDMPASTQILYVHLSLQADDDGFLGNPKKIQKMIGCSSDDLGRLVDENFIISFPSGVIAITHWKVHNRVRSDRYKETIYLTEKSRLRENATGVYELIPEGENGIPSDNHMDTNGIPSDNHADTNGIPSDNLADTNGIPSGNQTVSERYTQYSIGKDSVGKDSLVQVSPVQYSSVEVSSVSSSSAGSSLKDVKKEAEETKKEASEETKHQKEKTRENGTEPPITALPLKDGKEYPLFQKHVTAWDFMYPLVDVEREFFRMKEFLEAHPEARVAASAMNLFMMNWLRAEQEKIKSRRA